MLLALLTSLALAQGLDSRPTAITTDDLLTELDRLKDAGFDQVSIQVETDALGEALQEVVGERSEQVVDGAACVIQVGGKPDAMEAWCRPSFQGCSSPTTRPPPAATRKNPHPPARMRTAGFWPGAGPVR